MLRLGISRLTPSLRLTPHVRLTPRITMTTPVGVSYSVSPIRLMDEINRDSSTVKGNKALDNTDKSLEFVNDNFATRIYKSMFSGLPKSKLKASGYILCTHCAQTIDIIKFFETFNMPDTFYSWFLITELHVWLLGARVMNDGDYGRVVRNSMVEALWQDCDNRAKSIGDMATSTRQKKIAAICEEFQAALFVYDEGLLGNDLQLANALWRRFFLSMQEDEEGQIPDPEKLEILVNYVRRVSHYLDQLDSVDIIVKNTINWPPLIQK